MAKVLKLKAFKVIQPTETEDKAVYNTTIPMSILIDHTYFQINWWSPEKKNTPEQGYQRMPDENRKKKISKYLENAKNPVMPTNIVVSSHKPITFDKEHKNFGEITIDHYPLWIIDGQNRIEGFKYAINELGNKKLLEYEMPVTIMSNFEIIDESEQFITLNVTQKKVNTDLAQVLRKALIQEYGEERYKAIYSDIWDLKALNLTELLNTKSNGDMSNVWYQRIKQPNTKKSFSSIINQNSFVTSLKPLYKGGVFEYDYTADEAFQALKNYWEAVAEIFPVAFEKPRDYVIQKTPGVFSLNDLANRVFGILLKEKKNLTKENILEKLKTVFKDDRFEKSSNYWMANNYFGAAQAGSMKGFKRLADEFKENLSE